MIECHGCEKIIEGKTDVYCPACREKLGVDNRPKLAALISELEEKEPAITPE